MQKAALYIRVSTDDQTEYSPDAQKRLLLDYAAKNDFLVDDAHVFIDDGYSGRKAGKRPAFMQMISAAKKKPAPFDAILVHKFDRFARSREDSVVYKSLLKKDGIKVISITEHIEDDKFNIILESVLEAMAEYYSANLADEVRKGMTEKAMRGEVQSVPPYGYTVKDNVFVIVPEEAEVVRFIFDLILNGETSFWKIAKKLNDMGKLTKRGNRFQLRTVEYIAKNIVYAGKVVWCPDGKKDYDFEKESLIIRDGKHEPIVSLEDFEKVQTILSNLPKKKRNAQPSSTYRHWASGLLRCDACGSTLCFSGSYCPGFQCHGYSTGRCNTSHRITVKAVEGVIFASLESIINGNCKNYNLVRKQDGSFDMERKNLEKSLKGIDAKLERAKQAFLAGVDSLAEYEENKATVLAEKERLLDDLERCKPAPFDESHFKKKIGDLYELLKSDSDIEKKISATHQLIEKIVYNKQNEILEFYYYI